MSKKICFKRINEIGLKIILNLKMNDDKILKHIIPIPISNYS